MAGGLGGTICAMELEKQQENCFSNVMRELSYIYFVCGLQADALMARVLRPCPKVHRIRIRKSMTRDGRGCWCCGKCQDGKVWTIVDGKESQKRGEFGLSGGLLLLRSRTICYTAVSMFLYIK